MNRLTLRALASTGFAAMLWLVAPPATGQSYGEHDQVLTIGAAGLAMVGYLGPEGYVENLSIFALDFEQAPLRLPDGAEIRQMCLYSDDRGADDATEASLVAVKLVLGGGGGPFVLTIPNSHVTTTPAAGYAAYCTDPISFTVGAPLDLDGDGTPDEAAYYVKVRLAPGGRIGGVTVTWRRQVSPPPAVATFADVPASDGGFQYVEALVAAGITAGCGGNNYCPDSPLTRRQMAVYLAKALGLHWPN
jgi:hypothetical protein